MKYQWLTRLIVLGTPIIWIIYDLWTYYYNGNASTESATIFRYSVHFPGFVFLIGVLCGHWFFQMREPTAYPIEPKQ